MPTRARPLLAAALLLLAAGCDLTFPWSSTARRKANVAVTPGSLRFEAAVCDPSPPVAILSVTAARPDAILIAAIDPPGAPFFVVPAGPTRLMVGPAEPSFAGAGEHLATVRVTATTPAGPVAGERVVVVPLTYAVAACPLAVVEGAARLEVLAGVPGFVTTTVQAMDPDGLGTWAAEVVPGDCGYLDLGVAPAQGDALPATLTVSAALAPPSWLSGWSVGPGFDCAAELRVRERWRESVAPVRIRVSPQTVTFDPPMAVFTAYEAQADLPPAVTIAVTSDRAPLTYSAGWGFWEATVTDPQGVTPGSFTVALRSTGWGPGTYAGELDVSWTGGSASLPVRWTILPRSLAATPAEIALLVRGVTTVADLSQTVAITSSAGPIGWDASVDVTWLRASPASSTTDASAGTTLTPDLAWLAATPIGRSTATLTVSYREPNGAASTLALPVSLWMDLPLVRGGLPRAVVAGAAGALTVGGVLRGGNEAPAYSLDGAPAAAQRWGPDLDRVALPALDPGRHAVTVTNALGLDRGAAPFDAVTAGTRTPAAVAAPGHRTQLAFDDARGILYAANPGAGVVERFLEADGWARQIATVDGLRDAALATDGASLAAVAGGTIRVVDAAPFALAALQPSGALPGPDAATRDWRLAFAADGRALVVSASVDVAEYGFFDRVSVTGAGFSWCGGTPFAAADGSAIGIACPGQAPGYGPEMYEPAWTFYGLGGFGIGSPYPPTFDAGLVTFDEARRRVLLLDLRAPGATDTLLLDLGAGVYPYAVLPGKLPGTIGTAVVTRAGGRAVALDGATGNVRVFDLAALPAGASDPLAELGTPGGFAPPASPGASPVLGLSADERTLFLGGDAGVVVVPLP